MNQCKILTVIEVRDLLDAMIKTGRDATVDWTNHHIQVLSEVKVNPKKILSDGPMKYQDILHHIGD